MSQKVILYVEDDEFSRQIMELLFDDYPEYDLKIFADSTDFETCLNALPDTLSVILLDIHVQPIDGFAMLKVIRQTERFQSLPVLALTASVMGEEIKKLRESGFDGAIAKPINQDTFVDNMEDAIEGNTIWMI